MNISVNIKAIRELKRLSQAEVARRMDIAPEFYFRLEKREKKLSLEQIESIANALEVSVAELIGINVPDTIDKSDGIDTLLKENERYKVLVADLEDDKRRLKKDLEEYEFAFSDSGRLLVHNIAVQQIEEVMQILNKKVVLEQENDEKALNLPNEIFKIFLRGFEEVKTIEIGNIYNGDSQKFTVRSSVFHSIIENNNRLKSIIGESNIPLFRKEYYDFLLKYQATIK